MIITVTLNPAIDKTVEINNFEAGKVNRVSSARCDAGGKGINVSKMISVFGGKSKAVGILGGGNGNFIKEYLDRTGIENEFLFIEGETRTNLKIIDSIGKTNTDINEPGPNITCDNIEKLKEIVFGKIDSSTVLVFSGSIPAGIDKDIYGKWIADTKRAGAKVILDADGEALMHGVKAGPYLIKPNIHELEGFCGRKISSVREAEKLGKTIIEEYGVEIVVVSLGSKGALFINKEDSIIANSIKVDVKSTVGAGDSMVAALAYSIDRGFDFNTAARLAMASGTANVMTTGSQPAELATIVELEKQVILRNLDNSIDDIHI